METLINFETLQLAYLKGFNERCNNTFDLMDGVLYTNLNIKSEFVSTFQRPSQDQLKNWILKEHFPYVIPIPTSCYWTFKIVDVQCDPNKEIERPPYKEVHANDYSTFEEAFEAGLIESLNKVTNK